MFCQDMTLVMPQVAQSSPALAADVLFFRWEERSLPRFLRPDGVYREALRKSLRLLMCFRAFCVPMVYIGKRWALAAAFAPRDRESSPAEYLLDFFRNLFS